MYIDYLPLDISKTAQEIIIEKINAVNGLQLNFNDFVFEDPQPHSGAPYAIANTKVKIVPKTTSQYYNAFTVYYKRMDISEILDNPKISISRAAVNNLSELITDINQKYNIHLTADDYYDAALLPVDPLDPTAEVPVMFSCKVESLLFKGSYLLLLNRVVQAPVIPPMESADVFIVESNNYDPIHRSTVLCRTSNGDPVNNFVFMRNCDTVSEVDITSIIKLKNKGLIVFGSFSFTANLSGTSQTYTTNCINVSYNGKVLADANNLYGSQYLSNLTSCQDNEQTYHYVLDTANNLGSEQSHLYRFLSTGELDVSFVLAGCSYEVSYARIDSHGRIYVCSKLLSVLEDHDDNPATPDQVVKQYWIERYLSSGALDTTFSRVKLRIAGNYLPLNITNIDPIENDVDTTMAGVYVGLEYREAPFSNGLIPTVNGVPVVSNTITPGCGYLPILKINNNGLRDINFKMEQRGFAPYAVSDYQVYQSPKLNQKFVTAVGDKVAMLAYKRNPITGNSQKMPVVYSPQGELVKLSGDDYINSYEFTEAIDILSASHNTLIVRGKCNLPDGVGGILAATEVVVAYNGKGQPQGIVYKATETINGTPWITQILVNEGN